MSEQERAYLFQLVNLTQEGLAYYIYYRHFENKQSPQYLHLEEGSPQDLKKKLLERASISGEDFDKYWHELKSYRDKCLIHTVHDLKNRRGGNHPYLDNANKSFKALHSILYDMSDNNNKFKCITKTDALIEQYKNDLINLNI